MNSKPSDGMELLQNEEDGSSGWIRTSNPPVNSRMLSFRETQEFLAYNVSAAQCAA